MVVLIHAEHIAATKFTHIHTNIHKLMAFRLMNVLKCAPAIIIYKLYGINIEM